MRTIDTVEQRHLLPVKKSRAEKKQGRSRAKSSTSTRRTQNQNKDLQRKPRRSLLYKDQTSVFDVSYWEITKRYFFAGFVTGLGGFTATVLAGFIVSVILVRLVAPRLDSILTQTRTTLERAGFFPSQSASP